LVNVQGLVTIGFTYNQARIYLSLLKTGRSKASKISRVSNVPRQEVYRVIDELRHKGLVDKIVGMPNQYEAVPLDEALQSLISNKVDQCKLIQKKTKEILRDNIFYPLKKGQEEEYKIIILEGKQRIMREIKREHDSVEKRVKAISTLQRVSQMLEFCLQNYIKALDRGVKYQWLIEKNTDFIVLPESVKVLLAKPNFEVRCLHHSLTVNAALFDTKEATFNFFPSKSVAESPIIWTNHPSFLSIFQGYFDNLWESAVCFQTTLEKNAHLQI